MLDLGCGYGWHCKYVADQGAGEVLGINLSHRMIEEARKRNADSHITYKICGIEAYEYPENTWNCLVSNLALHYTGQMFLRLGLATVIVVGNTLIMKEQITLFSYLLFLIAASRLYDPFSGAMVNMAELFAVDL